MEPFQNDSTAQDLMFPYKQLETQAILRELYLTDEKAGEAFVAALRPEIKQLYNEHRAYWQAKYSRIIGGIQNFLLDRYLKSNNVTAGIHSYSEVVGLMVSVK